METCIYAVLFLIIGRTFHRLIFNTRLMKIYANLDQHALIFQLFFLLILFSLFRTYYNYATAEELRVIRGVGMQITQYGILGNHHQFITSGHILDLLINEGIVMVGMIYDVM